MSFDLHLIRLERGQSVPDQPEVATFLSEHRMHEPNEYGSTFAYLPDGSGIDFMASTEEAPGFLFNLRSLSDATIEFIHALAATGRMIIFNAQGTEEDDQNPLAIYVHPEQANDLPEGMHGVFCDSPAKLLELLRGGFSDWDEYRRQVVGGGGSAS